MSDVPPPTNVFEKMMTAARGVAADEDDEPVYTAVLYEARLEHADPSEPLWRVPYFGQAVRIGTAEAIFAKRKREHELDAAREDKDVGLHAVIDRFGPEAMVWHIVSSASGPRTVMRELANDEEIRLINQNGGVLRDMDTKLVQTLNLTTGGQPGDVHVVWAGIYAKHRRAYTKFKAAMDKHVKEYKSALVPQDFVDDDGYSLGVALSNFRKGQLREGMPDRAEIEAWAEALPKFEWDARKSDEYKASRVQSGKDQAANETSEQKAERVEKLKTTMATTESKTKRSKISKDQWKNASEETRAEWVKANSDGHKRPEVRAKSVQRGKDQAKREEEADPGCHSRRAINQRATELREELKRARLVFVPFEKSKKRRAEMRAASTDFSGFQGSAVLYMQSEDGKDIQRVQKDGNMGKRNIVGPVVDPPPPDAFDSD